MLLLLLLLNKICGLSIENNNYFRSAQHPLQIKKNTKNLKHGTVSQSSSPQLIIFMTNI